MNTDEEATEVHESDNQNTFQIRPMELLDSMSKVRRRKEEELRVVINNADVAERMRKTGASD